MGGRIVMEMLGQNTTKLLTVRAASPGKLAFQIEDGAQGVRAEIIVDSKDFVQLLCKVLTG